MVLQKILNHVFAKIKFYFLTQLFSFFFLMSSRQSAFTDDTESFITADAVLRWTVVQMSFLFF